MHYYAIVHEKTGKLLVIGARLPIYWVKKVAKNTATNHPGYCVQRINADHLDVGIQPLKTYTEYQLIEVCKEVCSYWKITWEWLTDGSRDSNKPVMKKVIFLILKHRFPGITLTDIARIFNHRCYSGISKSIKNAKLWLSIDDELMNKYYEPVKHIFKITANEK